MGKPKVIKRNKSNIPKSRKQIRKEQRKEKKTKRNEYYTSRNKPNKKLVKGFEQETSQQFNKKEFIKSIGKPVEKYPKTAPKNQTPLVEAARNKEKREQQKLENEMKKQRNRQMQEANEDEDKTIKKLEKLLKLNKRKNKSVPKSFSVDGLDYLLEVCDSENMKNTAMADQQLHEFNDEFEEDLALMMEDSDRSSDEEETPKKRKKLKKDLSQKKKAKIIDKDDSEDAEEDDEEALSDIGSKDFEFEDNSEEEEEEIDEITNHDNLDNSEEESEFSDHSDGENSAVEGGTETKHVKKNEDGTWEDIYGRLRDSKGNVIQKSENKYIPPAVRAKMAASEDPKNTQKIVRLKRQLKGLLNRLAESNMHNIATQIEDLYMNNSRNDMNSTLTALINEVLVSKVITPERLLMEHVLLITILHANIGTEVGAHFLQSIVKQFNEELIKHSKDMDNKQLDNLTNIIAQLYNFKLFDSKLIYEILAKLAEKFDEKNVECILLILKSVGFNLRKDNPLELKNLILNLQKDAAEVPDEFKNNARLKFMLDILLAIKNNNVSKIPNYDTTYSEHLKKILKGFIRKGNYVTQLNISLEDLLKADECGRWWVVGSAWSGNPTDKQDPTESSQNPTGSFSQQLLNLARKQRMNTDTRRNIFCVIMSSEDYLDAFEKLLRLGLKNQQEREIIHVIIQCCLQEKKYNPFYSILAQKFCEHDRKFQMTIKCSIWDKLKALGEHSGSQISNLAKLLSYLFVEKGLPISVLKVIQFGELDKVTLRFMRQILLGILLLDDEESCREVFEKIAQSDKLKMFRESLRLFIHHFLLRNLKEHDLQDTKKELLQHRAKIIDKLLSGREKHKEMNFYD